MNEKNTQGLENILKSTHIKNFNDYCEENKESMITGEESFIVYMKSLLQEKKITQQYVFLNADISERYGYKLLNGEKRTKQRDIILRICYAAEFSLEETQRALKKYGMPALYAKIPRDAFMMIIFNERPGDIIKVNEFLMENGMEPLRPCGLQD